MALQVTRTGPSVQFQTFENHNQMKIFINKLGSNYRVYGIFFFLKLFFFPDFFLCFLFLQAFVFEKGWEFPNQGASLKFWLKISHSKNKTTLKPDFKFQAFVFRVSSRVFF